MSVISLRLKERELRRIDELSKLERKDRSTAARELLDYGWELMMNWAPYGFAESAN